MAGVSPATPASSPREPTATAATTGNSIVNDDATVPVGQWANTFCSCCANDAGVCFQTCCCHCCTVANVGSMVDHDRMEFDLPLCILYGAILCPLTLGCVAPVMVGAFRRQLLERYVIAGESTCGTCCKSTCCCGCALCQVQHELAARGKFCGGMCATLAAPPAGPVMGVAQGEENTPPVEMEDRASSGVGVSGAVDGTVVPQGVLPPTGDWRSGLFDVGDSECVEGCCCLCCVMGHVGRRLDVARGVAGAEYELGTDLGAPPMGCGPCCGALLCPVHVIYASRRELVERYGIRSESWLTSLLLSSMCVCCAALQQRREMGYAAEWPGSACGVRAPVALVAQHNRP